MSITETLFDGPLDIIGDIHGEAEALARLLEALGYGEDGRHPTRRLVFVGDLVDRGPDSPGVVERVQGLVASGRAQCVLGNHELNILMGRPKDGNGWFHTDWDRYGRHPDRGWCYDWTRTATGAERERYLAFFRSLPLALERPDLRVVHACWHGASLSALEEVEDPGRACRERGRELAATWSLSAADEEALKIEHRLWEPLGKRGSVPPMVVPLAEREIHFQMGNPVKVITSGVEGQPDDGRPFWASGRWRMVARKPWWKDYDDSKRVIFGHYWRSSEVCDEAKGSADLFGATRPGDWLGPNRRAFCVDYSVGRRFRERRDGAPPFVGTLAALRTPASLGEPWRVFFDDRAPWTLDDPG